MDMENDSRIRVRFKTNVEEIRVTDVAIAVPIKLGRSGLSEVIYHLLASPNEKLDTPLDFKINNILLRESLLNFTQRYSINTEDVIEVEYFPLSFVSTNEISNDLQAWVGCVDASLSTCIIAGCYDGSLKVLDPYNLSVLCLTTAHNHPMKALKVVESPNNPNMFSIFTAGKDHMINGFQIEKNSKYCISQVSKMAGHSNSVESLDASVSLGLLFSGDWNGNILAWDMKPTLDVVANPKSEGPEKKKKKITSSLSVSTEIKSVSHLYMIKAHTQAVSGLQVSSSHNTIYTCSYDHTIRIFDIQQQDCISTFNSSKVCLSLDSSPRNNLIATSHPDGKVRIWDSRNPNNTESFGAYGSSHSWVARVKWAPDSEFIFSSISYDGSMHLWDLRSSVPLNTIEELHTGKGLCMDWLVESNTSNKEKLHIVTGGSDCMIKSSEATIY